MYRPKQDYRNRSQEQERGKTARKPAHFPKTTRVAIGIIIDQDIVMFIQVAEVKKRLSIVVSRLFHDTCLKKWAMKDYKKDQFFFGKNMW